MIVLLIIRTKNMELERFCLHGNEDGKKGENENMLGMVDNRTQGISLMISDESEQSDKSDLWD
jgi:hypothetical protein